MQGASQEPLGLNIFGENKLAASSTLKRLR